MAEAFLDYDLAQLDVLFDYFARAASALRAAAGEMLETRPAERAE
jgi:hypothetical protein